MKLIVFIFWLTGAIIGVVVGGYAIADRCDTQGEVIIGGQLYACEKVGDT